MSGSLWIFGRQTRTDYGPTAPVKCPNCGNTTYYHLFYVKTWFEWFFIKLFAYKKRYYLLCKICSRGAELKGQQIDAAKRLNEATSAYLNKAISAEQYKTVLAEVRNELRAALGLPSALTATPDDTT